ncbi:MAG: DUF1302 domain-containing protein [Rhodospirillales bacterium]|nr:DUF1302 domain-containing protein [Rhodospirillales bacterium]
MRNTRESDATGSLHPAGGLPPGGAQRRRGAVRRSGVGPIALATIVALGGGLLHVEPATAVEFDENGYRGSLDTTVSHGLTIRVEERDGTLANDVNGNDGELNYDRGIVSNVSKFTSDLDVRTGDFGAFVRATGFLDFENQSGDRERTPLSDAAKERVGSDVELLDAYVTAAFYAGDMPIDVRLGRHVLNWGESTFIPNGINAVNPFDVSKLRRPGSELREALLPVGAASVAVAPTDTLSVEAFYQFDWEETRIDPVGSYFSSTDYAGPGAEKAVITSLMEGLLPDDPQLHDLGYGFGPLTALINADLAAYTVQHPQLGVVPLPQRPQPAFDETFASVLRGPDRAPDDSGQWGMAVRYLAEELNDTEFGLYLINYHSRLPTVGAQTADRASVEAGLAAAGAVGAPTSHTVAAITQQVTAGVQQAVQAGLIPPAAAPGVIGQQVDAQVRGLASTLALDRYAKGGHYFLEYPEDIQLVGVSFNTVLGASGWALQGEYSLRADAPLQRAERKVLEDGLRPIITALGLSAAAPESLPGYLATYQPTRVVGYVERDVSQVQATATKVFGPTMGADSLAFVMEAAVMHVHDMPDKRTTPLESPAGGILPAPPASAPADTPHEADADATSWGYRIAARLDYNNVIGSINLFPYVQFLHDVSGNSPAPSGPFVEGRTALTLGVRADYLSRWQADVGFTRYAGDGNELLDRDFISASVKYSF